MGIVIDINGYNYWNPEETFSKWKYLVWTAGTLVNISSWKIEKI
tara:strand:- start:729 stop:860 length:132 start_codon:yes stop_codon:yes gene_type:complete